MTLYMSLYTIHDKYDGLESRERYLHIGNLSTDEETGMYTYDFNVIPKENIIALGEYRIKAVEATGSVNTATYEFGKIETPWEPGYLERTMEQMILGAYSEDVTLLGTVGEILFGFTPFDIGQDIRDMSYYIKRIQCGDISFDNIMMTAVSFLCIFGIGELFANTKYLRHLDNVNVDVSDVRNLAKVTEAAEECLESSPKTISNILEQADIARYGSTVDDVGDMGAVVIATNKMADGSVEAVSDATEIARRTQKMAIESVESSAEGTKGLTNIQKGNYGEMKMDDYYENQGYRRLGNDSDRVTDINQPTHQGIDGVYYNSNGHPPYVIGEAKYGSSKLSTLADGTPQMSDKWIVDRLEDAVGEEMANEIKMEMILNPDNVGSSLVHISADGNIDVTELIDGIKQ